jgi:hypothetical protein
MTTVTLLTNLHSIVEIRTRTVDLVVSDATDETTDAPDRHRSGLALEVGEPLNGEETGEI